MSVDRQVLAMAKAGDKEARDKIVRHLMADPRTRGAVYNLRKRSPSLEGDDVDAVFWLGVLVGLDHVKHDIGDPMAYLVQRGVWQVKSAVREELSRKVVQQCSSCGHFNGKYDYNRRCFRCGEATENVFRLETEDIMDESRSYLDSVASVTVDMVKAHLSEGQVRVLEALLDAHYQAPESPVNGAAKTLGISRQRVHQHLAKIRAAVGGLDDVLGRC